MFDCDQRRHGDGWRGIATDRFEHDGCGRYVNLAQLLGNQKALIVVRDDDWRSHVVDFAHA
ncbi:hypothetical protein NECAME_16094 [Necator americanus]|uniref:Uncharacterized protein n=1 Tax=Necator americanus TaxID=51031 RepID=W2U0I6_NECAM|nr:hypothetical protein NECAME_16094 [Necator americanus]ETN86861.1 hypothetical protein NECAME_16094 [Necator americanus]